MRTIIQHSGVCSLPAMSIQQK